MSAEAPVTLRFTSPPSVACAYGKAVFAQRPALVPAHRSVPRIEAKLERFELTRARIDAFARVAGSAPDHKCPLTLPHVAAMPLHLAILTSNAFPVRLLGLVHVENEIEQQRWLAADEPISLRASLEGYDDTPRGHEFSLETEASVDGNVVWRETSRVLARRPKRAGDGKPRSETALPVEPSAVTTTSWHCDADIGRRYGWISGDMNPIHLTDVSARLFGFDRAIAHGMWTLARIAHELGPQFADGALRIDTRFRAPIRLPAWVMLHHWRTGGRTEFRLRDSEGERIHVEGAAEPLKGA
jgi:acyl dehydratase